LEGAKCALRAGGSGLEITVARFLLLRIYIFLLPRLLEASGVLQRSNKEVIFLSWVRMMGGSH